MHLQKWKQNLTIFASINHLKQAVDHSICSRSGLIFAHTVYIQGGAEPTDTFRIGILRRRNSLSWLAARGTVEERTPFHMVRNSMAVFREMFGTVISRFGDIAWSARSPDLNCTRLFPEGVPERPCVLEAYHDYSRTQTSQC